MKKSILLAAVLAAMSMNAMADVMGASQMQPAKPTVPEITLPEGALLPQLKVSFDCGDCEQSEKIKGLIESAYLDQAKKQNVSIDAQSAYGYTISKYRSRGAARFVVGALSGADKIAGSFTCNGAAVEVSDMAVTVFNGIEAVAINVGEGAYLAAKRCVNESILAAAEVDSSEPYVPVLRDSDNTQVQ